MAALAGVEVPIGGIMLLLAHCLRQKSVVDLDVLKMAGFWSRNEPQLENAEEGNCGTAEPSSSAATSAVDDLNAR